MLSRINNECNISNKRDWRCFIVFKDDWEKKKISIFFLSSIYIKLIKYEKWHITWPITRHISVRKSPTILYVIRYENDSKEKNTSNKPQGANNKKKKQYPEKSYIYILPWAWISYCFVASVPSGALWVLISMGGFTSEQWLENQSQANNYLLSACYGPQNKGQSAPPRALCHIWKCLIWQSSTDFPRTWYGKALFNHSKYISDIN